MRVGGEGDSVHVGVALSPFLKWSYTRAHRKADNAMAFISFANVVYVELIYNIFQQTCQNTLYFVNAGDMTVQRLDALIAELAGWYATEMEPLVSDSLTLAEITARDMTTEFSIQSAQSFAQVGNLTSPALPLNVTAAIKFNTGYVGRRNRGRNFLVGLTEGQVTGNELISTVADDFIDAYEEMFALTEAIDFVHCVASRAGVNPTTGGEGAWKYVNSYSMDLFIDSQRRRLSGRGS